MPVNVLVLGAGTWGTTLAGHLHGGGHQVRVWEYAPEVVAELERSRRHPKLPDVEIPGGIEFTTEIQTAASGMEIVVCAVPAGHVRETFRGLAGGGYSGQMVVICSKGIEDGTHALLSEVVSDELGAASRGRIGVLSGPSHAEEVSRQIPTAVTASAEDIALAERIRDLFMTPTFRIYTQTDLVGVELAAALKNVIAIACGISDGLGFGDNSKAALMTRGLSEIVRLGIHLGARAETFYGLAGIGDLMVTCMSGHSRNRNFGYHLGRGLTTNEALEQVGMVVEGYYTVRAAAELAVEHGIEMPITVGVDDVVFKGLRPLEAGSALMMRDPGREMEM